MRNLVYFSLITLVVFIQATKDAVPVLVWSNNKSPQSLPAVSALQVVQFAAFQEKYLNSFNLQNVLLFIQDSLSVEDLSSHAEELKHISAWTESSHSLFLPSVEDASHLAHSLPAHGYNMINLESGSSVSGITLNKNENNLVLVRLPSTINNPSRKKALQKTDEVIQSVISKIGQLADFTIIFTGKIPSVNVDSALEHRRTSRSLQQANDNSTAKFHKTECVLLYLRTNIVIYKGNQSYTLLESNSAGNATGDCHENDATIRLKYKDINQIDKVFVEFRFHGSKSRWWLNESEIYEQTQDRATAILTPTKGMEKVPMGKSYACAQPLIMTTKTGNYKMIVDGVQVEAFTVKGAMKFSNSWDCVGFFTIPIWMGILSGILCTFILLFGLYMLGDVKTMDRFDDPKGKHFLVTSAAE